MSNYFSAVLPWPPSVNTLYAVVRGRKILSARGREYHRAVGFLCKRAKPLTGRLSVSMALHPPDRRRRDISNFVKVVEDALTQAGVWVDDSQIDDLHVVRTHNVPNGEIVVNVLENV